MAEKLEPLVTNMEPELVRRLNVLYGFYHRQWWCYRQRWNQFKLYHTLLNALALFLVATGMIVGPVLKKQCVGGLFSCCGNLCERMERF